MGQGDIRAKLGLWHFYTYDHWGGAAIAIGGQDIAMTIHKWDYDHYYSGNPACVFWQDLTDSNTNYSSYVTAPSVWRSYAQMTGALVDNANNRLWVRPMIPSSMGKTINNAPILNAKGWGTLNYNENPSGPQLQTMTVTFDSLITIKEIVLKNNTTVDSPGVAIKQNGINVPIDSIRIKGAGFEKLIRVFPAHGFQIGSEGEGVGIKVYNGPIPAGIKTNNGAELAQYPFSLRSSHIAAGLPILYSLNVAGPVSLELIGLNGAKIGMIMRGISTAGKKSFVWNGRFVDGRRPCFVMAIMRLHSLTGSISKLVLITTQ